LHRLLPAFCTKEEIFQTQGFGLGSKPVLDKRSVCMHTEQAIKQTEDEKDKEESRHGIAKDNT
jgi:hypothetical protein